MRISGIQREQEVHNEFIKGSLSRQGAWWEELESRSGGNHGKLSVSITDTEENIDIACGEAQSYEMWSIHGQEAPRTGRSWTRWSGLIVVKPAE